MRIFSLIQRYLSPTGSVAFWHTELKLLSPYKWDKENYPIDFTSKVDYSGPFDDAGIPMLDYKGDIAVQYNPTAIAQFGLGCLQSASVDEVDNLRMAVVAGEWLIDWSELHVDQTAWLPYKFAIVEAGLESPFYSGLAQAMAYSLLIRLAVRTGDRKFSDHAEKLIAAMIKTVEHGGFLREYRDSLVIEEFILDRPSVVLDGWLFSIMALIDEDIIHEQPQYGALLERSIDSLKTLLPLFELGYWSRTDLYFESPSMPSSKFYHKLHIDQLICISRYFEDSEIEAYASRWLRYLNNPYCRWRATGLKIILKLARY